MPKQPAFPGLRDAMKRKVTRREQFLSEMDAVVPWSRLLALIAPYYPKAGPKGGRPPMPLETMLRVYFLQNWYALSDPMAEDALRQRGDAPFRRDRAGRRPHSRRDHDPELPPPAGAARADRGDLRRGERASGRQGHHAALGHAGGCDDHRRAVLDEEQGRGARSRDVVDEERQRLVFGSKEDQKSIRGIDFPTHAHVGVDADSGVVHSLETSTARLHDSQVWDELLHGEETSVWAELPSERHRSERRWRRLCQRRARD